MPYNKNEVKKCPLSANNYGSIRVCVCGSFCARGIGYWVSCRDTWQAYRVYNNLNFNTIFFRHSRGEGKRVANFIDRIEDLKSLKVDVKTEMGPTEDSKITWIQASPWWSENAMRYSLFTALLRAGRGYTPAKLDYVIENGPYIRHTPKALKKFLRGYTVFKRSQSCPYFNGWLSNFSDDKNSINLVKPKK